MATSAAVMGAVRSRPAFRRTGVPAHSGRPHVAAIAPDPVPSPMLRSSRSACSCTRNVGLRLAACDEYIRAMRGGEAGLWPPPISAPAAKPATSEIRTSRPENGWPASSGRNPIVALLSRPT